MTMQTTTRATTQIAGQPTTETSSRATTMPPRFLRTPEAALFLGLSPRTLEKHRTYGTGPAYRKLGGRVVYALHDIEAWTDRGAVTSTSDRRGTVLPAKRHAVFPDARFTGGHVPGAHFGSVAR